LWTEDACGLEAPKYFEHLGFTFCPTDEANANGYYYPNYAMNAIKQTEETARCGGGNSALNHVFVDGHAEQNSVKDLQTEATLGDNSMFHDRNQKY
jgi:hypothetical protein